jgi:hypothetical protein
MDARGLFEMLVIFTVMVGCGTIVVDKNQPETSRAQAFAIVAGLIGTVCPSPITRSIERVNHQKKSEENNENS